MIDKKIFFESIKAFLINFGFEMKEEDLQIYCRLCYEFFTDSKINDNDFIDAVQKIIKSCTKEELKHRPTGAEFYELVYKNTKESIYKIAEIEFNKALIKTKYGLYETMDNITEYLIDNIENIVDNKNKFIELYVETKNNEKISNTKVFLIENKKDSKRDKEIDRIINDLSKRLAGNY